MGESPDCLRGEVRQPTNSRLSETIEGIERIKRIEHIESIESIVDIEDIDQWVFNTKNIEVSRYH